MTKQYLTNISELFLMQIWQTKWWFREITAVDPFLTASWAYSTWKRWPSGEKTVIALSYRELMFSLLYVNAIRFTKTLRKHRRLIQDSLSVRFSPFNMLLKVSDHQCNSEVCKTEFICIKIFKNDFKKTIDYISVIGFMFTWNKKWISYKVVLCNIFFFYCVHSNFIWLMNQNMTKGIIFFFPKY